MTKTVIEAQNTFQSAQTGGRQSVMGPKDSAPNQQQVD